MSTDDLGPPPPPKPVKMPPMPEHMKEKMGPPATGPPVGPKPGASPPMEAAMMGGLMPGGMMCGGYPTVGGMGPNLVFNFSSPYSIPYCYPTTTHAPHSGGGGEAKGGPAKEVKKHAPQEKKKVYVQAKPSFGNPRVVAKIGKPRQDPCVIM